MHVWVILWHLEVLLFDDIILGLNLDVLGPLLLLDSSDVRLNVLHDLEEVILHQQVEIGFCEAALRQKVLLLLVVEITEAHLLEFYFWERFQVRQLLWGQLPEFETARGLVALLKRVALNLLRCLGVRSLLAVSIQRSAFCQLLDCLILLSESSNSLNLIRL